MTLIKIEYLRKIAAEYKMNSHLSFLQLALSRGVVINAIKVSLVVGSILAAINHGSAIVRFDVTLQTCFKIFLSYVVPYCVASYSAVSALQRIDLENQPQRTNAIYTLGQAIKRGQTD
ncbi:MAG: nitrate/nitrite transporter NrtS [Arenicella sp.]|nr:nitrate/nitrite transporter NrtS [Arenicella sp.]